MSKKEYTMGDLLHNKNNMIARIHAGEKFDAKDYERLGRIIEAIEVLLMKQVHDAMENNRIIEKPAATTSTITTYYDRYKVK